MPLLAAGLIVSCQARDDNPLTGAIYMTAMAKAALQGGAIGLRANGPEDIRAIKREVDLPLIGLWKVDLEDYDVYITPTLASARAVAEAGADIIAIDATHRPHPEGSSSAFISKLKAELGLPVFADISSFDEGIQAEKAGADYVSTTMSGYTPYSPKTTEPDFKLIHDLSAALDIPLIAEGRFWTPEQVAMAFELGAYAVVVGTAITNPREITRRFMAAVPKTAVPKGDL